MDGVKTAVHIRPSLYTLSIFKLLLLLKILVEIYNIIIKSDFNFI
jgi:hypothetical protein